LFSKTRKWCGLVVWGVLLPWARARADGGGEWRGGGLRCKAGCR